MLAWQSPYQVYTTLDTTYIGALVFPLLSKEMVYDWYEMVEGERRPLDMSEPFILVPPGTYGAKMTLFMDKDTVQQSYINPITVLKCSDLFKGMSTLCTPYPHFHATWYS